LTSGEAETKAEKSFDRLLRKELIEFIQTASKMTVAKLNLIVLKLKEEEQARLQAEANTVEVRLLA